VGGFFVISGYVSAYTSTKLGERGVEEKKVANPELFFWQRVTMPRWNMTDGSFRVFLGADKMVLLPSFG